MAASSPLGLVQIANRFWCADERLRRLISSHSCSGGFWFFSTRSSWAFSASERTRAIRTEVRKRSKRNLISVDRRIVKCDRWPVWFLYSCFLPNKAYFSDFNFSESTRNIWSASLKQSNQPHQQNRPECPRIGSKHNSKLSILIQF